MCPISDITPYPSAVSRWERMRVTGTRPFVYWFTGLSGAGKSTIAALAEKELINAGFAATILDGDTMRTGLCKGLSFTADDRRENLRRIAEVAKVTAMSGQVVLVTAISPDEESRKAAREIISSDAGFSLVYVRASLETCAARDPKGLYKKAYAGEISDFTGVSAPYETPDTEIVLDTDSMTADEAAACLLAKIEEDQLRLDRILDDMIRTGLVASDRIMAIYQKEFSVVVKDDSSPLTEADLASNAVIHASLLEKYPEMSFLSEEELDPRTRLLNQAGVFIVDPLDGTQEFVEKNGEFCISIAFVRRNEILVGVVLAPTLGLVYYAVRGKGAYKLSYSEIGSGHVRAGMGERLHVSDRMEKVIYASSRSHSSRKTDELLELNRDRILKAVPIGSCLKGCMIAEGKADVHYRFGDKVKEWDTAGMQIICEEAGASFTELDGTPIMANRPDFVHRHGYRILNHPESALVLPDERV